jgi:hypothetical protein
MSSRLALVRLIARRLRDGGASADISERASVNAERYLDNPLYLYQLASLCRDSGHIELWREAVNVALTLEHLTPQQTYYRGLAKLTLGDWSGWADREARHFRPIQRSKDAATLRWSHQAWDGQENIQDKLLLVYYEQGFGDGIQMLRFLPFALRSAGRVVLMVRSGLASLVERNFGAIVEIALREDELPPFCDRYVWSMSLPSLLGHLPAFAPLSTRCESTQAQVDHLRAKVGLCWAGHPVESRDRSIPIALLAPLFLRNDTEYYSLQVGEREADACLFPTIRQPSPPLQSFYDTAVQIAQLDCVISIDTAVCHLAGAMGVPTFTMLPYASDWRWGLESATPWYPTMRLIRQTSPGDWPSAVRMLMTEIDGLSRERGHARSSGLA